MRWRACLCQCQCQLHWRIQHTTWTRDTRGSRHVACKMQHGRAQRECRHFGLLLSTRVPTGTRSATRPCTRAAAARASHASRRSARSARGHQAQPCATGTASGYSLRTCNTQHAKRSMQCTACNRQQTTCNRQHAPCKHAPHSMQRARCAAVNARVPRSADVKYASIDGHSTAVLSGDVASIST